MGFSLYMFVSYGYGSKAWYPDGTKKIAAEWRIILPNMVIIYNNGL
jgi:hypothetical protein